MPLTAHCNLIDPTDHKVSQQHTAAVYWAAVVFVHNLPHW